MIKNVLKEDFYRLKRSKTLWICLTVAVVFSFLITTFYNFAIELAGEYGVYTGVDLNEYMAPELMAAMAFLNPIRSKGSFHWSTASKICFFHISGNPSST